VIDDTDRWCFPEIKVTTPLRTAIDLARFRTHFDSEDARALAFLMRLGSFDVTDCINAMDRRRNLPNKKVAASRLHVAWAELARTHPIDVVDSVDAPHGVEYTVEVGRISHLEDKSTDRQPIL